MPERSRWYKRIKLVGFLREKWSARHAKNLVKSKRVSKPRTYKPIHLATLIMLAVVALTVTAVAAWFMWDAAQVPARFTNSPDLAVRAAQLRVDVIRNILAVGAGAGGLIALFVALRRQYVKERVDHADQEYKNRTAEDTKHDAAERRVTELYTKAAEQLGSDKAPVRMAALYALERMGQGNPEHRQTVVNLICAYLRMPFNPPFLDPDDGAAASEDKEKRQQEEQVRLAAQKVLSDHLRNRGTVSLEMGRILEEDGGASFWPKMSIDLSGAVLSNFDFSSCSVASIRIQDARFYGVAVFSSLVSHGVADFSRTQYFCPAYFRKAFFLDSRFRAARFYYQARFDRTEFGIESDFSHANFGGPTRFVRVGGTFNFREAKATWKPSVPHVWPQHFGLVRDDSVSEEGWIIRTSLPDDVSDLD
ncbi:hypothetical protein [Micromonospora sp. WMMD736]|uniref:hypothetical protein n=1 Tax=Micromonospora sp. WMMD736 TaxID=3404112 RepID=UPI003B925FE9